jgi:hypothetical protein
VEKELIAPNWTFQGTSDPNRAETALMGDFPSLSGDHNEFSV